MTKPFKSPSKFSHNPGSHKHLCSVGSRETQAREDVQGQQLAHLEQDGEYGEGKHPQQVQRQLHPQQVPAPVCPLELHCGLRQNTSIHTEELTWPAKEALHTDAQSSGMSVPWSRVPTEWPWASRCIA